MPKSRRKACSAKRTTPEKLWEMLHEKFDGRIDPYEFDKLGQKFMDDIGKVDFDFENFEYNHLEETIGRADGWLGYRKLWTRSPLSCFSFIGCYAGGDWEYPVNFLIYLDQDGKTFRGYVPKEGNVWNYDTKEAIGNDEEADAVFLQKWVEAKTNSPVDEEWDTHRVDPKTVLFDPIKMAEEIMFRFEAVD